ncbi:hypothetical protein PGT21_016815 [Puccinia graminis f. sp. tritici]|uniref:Uncharacterized protein n=1 Tax=Puccinia graminis f. sp. tritici TaxID=56615 RepID=A0A5B0QIQ1_PUCGR|nr:hypothetical protein PGT21_016815 [Puccinia graminis f. sp. tritici]
MKARISGKIRDHGRTDATRQDSRLIFWITDQDSQDSRRPSIPQVPNLLKFHQDFSSGCSSSSTAFSTSQVIANFYAHTNPESHPFPHPIELCLSIASALSCLLLRPQRLLNLSLSRRRASTKQSPKPARLYTPTCTCAIGPNGGILLSPTAVKNLFNCPEFKHQKQAILPYKKWRLQRQRRLKDNKNKV